MLSFRDFWGRPKVQALKALDLQVHRGEIFGLLGPNGSGKTTTIKLLLGLLFPTEGDALIFDEPTTNVAKNERIGYLPEESYLYKFLNAEETLHFYGRLFKISASERTKRVDRLIDMVGLNAAKHRQLREYSKGMQRRIGLAQALINDPELILLDEPTSGLDPIGTAEMKELIRDLRAQGKTIVLSGHLLADMQDICDRIAILHRGELKELGKVTDLLTVQDVTQIKTRDLSEAALQEIREVIARHGAELRGGRPPDDDPGRALPADRPRERPAPGPSPRGGERRRPVARRRTPSPKSRSSPDPARAGGARSSARRRVATPSLARITARAPPDSMPADAWALPRAPRGHRPRRARRQAGLGFDPSLIAPIGPATEWIASHQESYPAMSFLLSFPMIWSQAAFAGIPEWTRRLLAPGRADASRSPAPWAALLTWIKVLSLFCLMGWVVAWVTAALKERSIARPRLARRGRARRADRQPGRR